jgi:hypothetical protein
MNFRAKHGIADDCVEAITLSQPVLQSSPFSKLDGRNWTVSRLQSCVRIAGGAISNPAVRPLHLHFGEEIRQMISRSGCPDSRVACGIQTEEKHTGLAAEGDVCTNIQLRETRVPRQRKKPSRALTVAGGTGQCANSKSFHTCSMIHGPEGSGRGRWSTDFRMGCTNYLRTCR